MISRSTLLATLAVVLVVVGLLSFALDRLMVAGVCFLAVSMTIYVREKNL